MRTLFTALVVAFFLIPFANEARSWDWLIKNKKGFVEHRVTDKQNRVEVRDKKGFVEGWFNKSNGVFYNKKGFRAGSVTPAPGKVPRK